MENNIRSIGQSAIIIVTSIVIGYILFYYIFIEIFLMYFFDTGMLYHVISYEAFALVCTIIAYGLLRIIKHHNSKLLLSIIAGLYIVFLLLCLFCRQQLLTDTIINPLDSFRSMLEEHRMSLIGLRIFAAMPFGLLLYGRIRYQNMIVLTISISVALEIARNITMFGSFENLNIILYLVGVMAGYYWAGLIPKSKLL